MSAEHAPRPQSAERVDAGLAELAKERLDALAHTPERAPDHQEHRAEAARDTIARHEEAPQPTRPTETTLIQPSFSARLDRAVNYTHTLQSVQRRLNPVSRSFSQVIHQPAIEAASEALERSIMRPSVISGALWAAALVGGAFYLVARTYGYQMSGTEMLASLLAGGMLGVSLETFSRWLRRRQS